MSKEIESKVAELLASYGVAFSAVLRGTTKRDDWDCDEWAIEIFKAGKPVMRAHFFTGIGLRVAPKRAPSFSNVQNPRELARWKEQHTKPVTPSSANVLHSLLLDGEAINDSFDNWADNYGYDSDSLKALNIYKACCETGRKMQTIFSHEQLAELREALQDY